MPRIKGIAGPYRIFFTSFDCLEPPHVHIDREDKTCKFWLDPVALARNNGFTARELRMISRMIDENRIMILEAWHEHCG
jgi:hypothetical protein